MNPFDELKGFDTYNYVMGHKEKFKKGTKMSMMWAQMVVIFPKRRI